jgi:ABC-type transporter MlaC component
LTSAALALISCAMKPWLVQVSRPLLARLVAVAAILGSVAATNGPARADATSDAIALVQKVHQTALDIDQGGSLVDLAKETQAIRAAFDGPAIGQLVLGKAWTSASTSDRSAFVDALLDAIVQGIADRLQGTENRPFEILATQSLPNGDVVVKTQFDRPVRDPIPVDWRVRRCQNAACIADVSVSGASVAVQKRDDVAAQLAANGGSVAAVIASLRQTRPAASP